MRLAWPMLTGAALTIATWVRAQESGVPPTMTREATASEAASQAFWKGKAYYDAGEFSLAIEQFKLAYGLTKDADLLYNSARSYRKAGQCSQALDSYRSFLSVAPESQLADQAERQVTALRQKCDSQPSASPPTGNAHAASVAPSRAGTGTNAGAPPKRLEGSVPQPIKTSELHPRSHSADTWAI